MKDLFVAFLAMLWRHILQQRAVFCCHLMRWFYCGVQICCHFEVVERWQAAQMMRASQGHGRALCSSRPSFISCVCVSLLLLARSLSLSLSLSLVSMLLRKIYFHKRGRIDEAPGKGNNPNSIGKVFQNSQDTCNCQMQIPRRKCPTIM